MKPARCTVVMPAYNEAEFLESSVKDICTALRDRGEGFEIIVVENGSTDETAAIADALAADMPEVRAEHLAEANYGRALRHGLLAATGDAVVNFDVDYFDVGFLATAREQVLAPDGPAILVGSKRAEGADDRRSPFRKAATWTFATILRVVFGLKVSDTHGMKALRRAAVTPLAEACFSGQDLFDTELILRAERAGLGVAEVPVTVRELRPARSPFLARVPRTLLGLCKLRIALWKEQRRR